MLYNCIKILHILSAALLLTSIAYCCHSWRQNILIATDRIQHQTWSIIIPFAVFQLATGFTMISLQHYELSALWISGSIIGFMSVMGSWFAFIYFLVKSQGTRFRRLQFAMLLLCSLSLLSLVFFMANKVV